MNDFTASTGHTFSERTAGVQVTAPGVHPLVNAKSQVGAAFKEYADHVRSTARAEEDARLARWRWPENPDYVVYPRDTYPPENARRVRVILEPTGDFVDTVEGSTIDGPFKDAARAYFDAHPEPKPWYDAGPAEVWDVDLPSGGMRAVTVYSARHEDEPVTVFRDAHTQVEIETDDPTIRDARRIYPERTV